MGRPGSHVLHDTWFRYFYFTPGGMLYYCMTHKERPPKYLSDSHWYPGTYYQHLKDSRVQVALLEQCDPCILCIFSRLWQLTGIVLVPGVRRCFFVVRSKYSTAR